MESSVTVKSSRDTTRLNFADITKETFSANLEGANFSGRVSVSLYMAGPPSALFDEMARDWKGWKGTKTWAALEDELRMEASADSTGHVSLAVTMRDYSDPAEWRLKATLDLEAGQLPELAKAVAKAFQN
jgi:hypothetical protein